MSTTARSVWRSLQVVLDHRHPLGPLVLGDLGVAVAGQVAEADHAVTCGPPDWAGTSTSKNCRARVRPGVLETRASPFLRVERVEHRRLADVAAPHEGELGEVGRRGPFLPFHGGAEELGSEDAKGHGATIMPHGPAPPPPGSIPAPPRPSRDGARALLAGDHPGPEHPGRRGGPLRRALDQGQAGGAHGARLQGGAGHRRHPPGPVPGLRRREGGRDQRLPGIPAGEGGGPRDLREGSPEDLHRRLPHRLALPRHRRRGLLREGRRGGGHPLPGRRQVPAPRTGRGRGPGRSPGARPSPAAPAAPAGR